MFIKGTPNSSKNSGGHMCIQCNIHVTSLTDCLGISCCIYLWTAWTDISELIYQLKKTKTQKTNTKQWTNRLLVEIYFLNCWRKYLFNLEVCICGARAFPCMMLKSVSKKDKLSFFSSAKLIWNACRLQKQIEFSPTTAQLRILSTKNTAFLG